MMNNSTRFAGAGRIFSVCLLALFLCAGSLSPLHAQQTGTVSGEVKDENGNPIIGVNVVVQGTTRGMATGINGEYSLDGVNLTSDVLVFSYITYQTQEIPVSGRAVINVTLVPEINSLNEVVVVGYGTMARREISSAIVSVNKQDFRQGAVGSAMEMLTGKVAGLNVNNVSLGDPNYSSDVQIRGATSFTLNNGPLYVIDGFIGGDIKNISPQDIESMTVLKDAAASAIYGVRSANGVIIVTTKTGRGAVGSHNVTYDSWFGMNFAKDIPQVLDAEEFRRSMRRQDYGASTDWYKEILRDFSYDNNQYVSFDGTAENGSYSASLNYRKAKGLDIASGREEYGARFAANHRALDGRLEFNGSLSGRKVHEDWGDNGQFRNALSLNPTHPVYNPDGTFNHRIAVFSPRNPVEELTDHKRGGDRVYLLGNAEVRLHILRGPKHSLNTALNYSLQYNDLNQYDFIPSTTAEAEDRGFRGRATLEYNKWWFDQVEWITNYTFSHNSHIIRAMAGYSYTEENSERRYLQNSDFAEDSFMWHSIQSGSWLSKGEAGMASDRQSSKLIAVFGRVNYSWNDILMASASLRYEGSTKFGRDHKWGYFPAASVAWEMSNMDFMENTRDWINSLKLRASYGVTGRTPGANYGSLATYGPAGRDPGNRTYWYLMNGEWVQGYGPTYNANPNLGWEKAITFNVGVDFVLWNRLRGSLDYYNRQSRDLLYDYRVPQPPYIQSGMMMNLATTVDNGFEFALDADIITGKDFTWNSSLTYSYDVVKVKEFSDDPSYQADYFQIYDIPGVGTTEQLFRSYPGDKLGNFWGYQYTGVENGELMGYNINNEIVPIRTLTQDDKRVIGNGMPNHLLSWNNTMRYKNFDLSLSFTGAFGFDVFNLRNYELGLMAGGSDNVLREAYLENSGITQAGRYITSFYLEKGDYFKLDNVTLGYNFDLPNAKFVKDLRVYLSAKNIFTFTGYSGTDPSRVPVTGLGPGVDHYDAYPLSTQVSVGVMLRFM